MDYWRINTDTKGEVNPSTCDLWYQYGMAFVGDHVGNQFKHAGAFKKLKIGDGIFMHHSGLGIVGYGIVAESWNGVSYTGQEKILYHDGKRKEFYEYRICVEWDPVYDRRSCPVRILGRLPYRSTYSRIDPMKWNIPSVLQDLLI